MKKNRNTFFTNYNAEQVSYIPNNMPFQNQIQPGLQSNQFGPFQSANTQTSFYAGPDIAASNEFENRLAKIERQLNRLDARISKLESNNTTTQTETNNYSNMYIV